MPPVLLACSALALVLAACGGPEAAARVTLSDAEESAAAPPPAEAPLRFALSPLFSPRKALEDYGLLLRRVGESAGRPVEFVSRTTYAEAVSLLEHREADAAFLCSGPYVTAHDRFGAELLAVPVMRGRTEGQSCLIVPRESSARALEDLRDGVFAFTDPDSNAGKLYPDYQLFLRGFTPEGFFARTIYSQGHDNSLKAVAARIVDGASVACFVLDRLSADEPAMAGRVKVIARSPAFGNPPIVVHPRLDPELKRRLRRAFLALDKDEAGRELLGRVGIDRFAAQEDSAYDGVRRMRSELGRAERGRP